MTPIESASKLICHIGDDLKLVLKVTLATKDRNKNRVRFISEYSYNSNKYNGAQELSSVTVETGDFLILESVIDYEARMKNPSAKSKSVWFSYENLWTFVWALESAYEWLVTNQEVYLYQEGSSTIITGINPAFANLVVICDSPYMRQYTDAPLVITPTVKLNRNSRESEKAVLITMGKNRQQITSLNAMQIGGLLHTVSRFDLCANSMALVNEVLIAAPMIKRPKQP